MSSERIVARHPKLASADEWIHSIIVISIPRSGGSKHASCGIVSIASLSDVINVFFFSQKGHVNALYLLVQQSSACIKRTMTASRLASQTTS